MGSSIWSGELRPVVLQVWSPNQQHCLPGNLLEMQILGCHLRSTTSETLGCTPVLDVLTELPGDSDACYPWGAAYWFMESPEDYHFSFFFFRN